jgi:hypothetical protein
MDSGCNLNRDCPAAGLTSQPPEKYNACKIKQQAPEPVDGCEYPPFSPTPPLSLSSLFSNR